MPQFIKLNASTMLHTSLEPAYILYILRAGPVQRAVSVVEVILETAAVQLLLSHLVAFRFEVQHTLVKALSCEE